MNKISIISIIAGITLPLLGMSITPTRNAILSLAPEESVLALADKIDEQRVLSEQSDLKVIELQSQIDNQQQIVDEQNRSIKGQNEESKKVAECAELQSKNPMCNNQDYKKTLNDYLKTYLKQNVRSEDSKDDVDEWRETGTKNWNICQSVYSKC